VLAIPRGHPPPTQLPAEFHNYVKVFEIVNHLPGFVYLEFCYLLTESVEDGKYSYIEYDRGRCLLNIHARNALNHGPAMVVVGHIVH